MASTIPEDGSTRPSKSFSRSSSIASESNVQQPDPPLWEVEDADVQRFVYRTDKSPSESSVDVFPDSPHVDVDCGSWQDAPNWKCHASFGDHKTTATVGAYGQLLQFSGFLEIGSSGMFSADHKYVPEPCLVSSRAESLQELSEQPFHFGSTEVDDHYGLSFPGLTMKSEARPDLKWTSWRWPQHVYPEGSFEEFPNLKMRIQWMVHEDTVLQQCLLENNDDKDVQIDVMFHMAMRIRDLDHLDWDSEFNEAGDSDHEVRPGPKGYSCVFVHKLDANPPSQGTPHTASNRLRHSNMSDTGGSHVCEGEAPSHVPPSFAAVHVAGSSVRNSRHDDESGICGSLREESLSHTSNSGVGSRIAEIWAPESKPKDHEAQPKTSRDISVITSVAIDGKFQIFEDQSSPHKPGPQKWSFVVGGRQMPGFNGRPQTHEVTTAYEMRAFGNSKPDWKAHVIPLRKMTVSRFLRDEQPAHPLPLPVLTPEEARPPKHKGGDETTRAQEQYFPMEPVIGIPGTRPPLQTAGTPQSHLGFAARRNLEHILSVCAIRATPKGSDNTSASLPEELESLDAVALTCGDMSGHRICWSASFFAIRFLVAFHGILSSLPTEQHVSVLDRIKKTCLGHLKWLHLAQQQNSGPRFGANYWVTGKVVVKPAICISWMPGDSILDTGFQILKAAACTDLCAHGDTKSKLMSEWAPSWLGSMEKSDKRQKYAWPHSENEGVSTFRLDDHVWIWRALKSLEDDDRQAWNLMSKTTSNSSSSWPSKEDIGRLRKTFASDVVQREVTKRFTTENDVFQKRMLAVTRSARETRFLLHSRDTALFYNEMSDFLGRDTSVQAWNLWKNTIDCQVYHDGHQEYSWENSLRYALCIIMGTQELKINSRTPDEMVRTAIEVLFRSSSVNGFFPGSLELLTKKPVEVSSIPEEERDFYYHASFEIPYILLTHASQVCDVYNRLATPTSKTTNSKSDAKASLENCTNIPLQGLELTEPIFQPQQDPGLFSGEPDDLQLLLNLSKVFLSQQMIPGLEKQDIVGNLRQPATHQRVVMKKTIPFNNLINSSSIVKIEDEWLFKYPEFLMKETPPESKVGDNVPEPVEDAQHAPESSRSRELDFCVIDVPSKKLIAGKQTNRSPEFNYGYWNNQLSRSLSRARTARDSKKRLVHFQRATKDVISTCCGATEASERDNMQEFFLRHEHYEKHAIDQCNMVSNTWETELHLSFYQILEGRGTHQPGIPSYDPKPFPGGQEKQIVRAAVSFRFQGDFFDRFWTCYMLEHSQNGPVSNQYLLSKKENRQRKVLEERYFLDILKELIGSTTAILQEVKTFLGFKSGLFNTSIHSSNAYSTWSSLWQKFEPLLQELDDDIRSTQVTVDQWEAREEERGEEKPRWTRSDERKYRAAITRVRREIKHEKRKLKDLHANIKTLREACSNRLVKAREELSFRSEQNIAMFTYVTVVFLPLGFTASIFSMNGSPETSLVINMVVASFIALAVTILALMNAKGLAGVVENISTSFKDLTANAKKSSVMVRDREKSKDTGIATNANGSTPSHLTVASTDAISWNLVFWTVYIFIELPSRSITAACRTLGWPRDNNKDLEGLKESKRVGPFARSVVASGLRYCLVPSMTLLDMEAAALLERTSLEFPREPIPQLVADDKLRKDGYATRIARVLLGIFTVPIFLSTWVLQILCFNACDALALLGELVRQGFNHISLPESDGSESSLMTHLTRLPGPLRPMKSFKNHLRTKKKPLKSRASTTVDDDKEIVVSLDKLSQTVR